MKTGFEQGGLLRMTSMFGANDLLPDRLDGSEGISEPFRFHLSMRSGNAGLDLAAAVGTAMSVEIGAPGGEPRRIAGIVARIAQTGQDRDFAVYEAEIVPTLWLLTLGRDRRSYVNLGVDAIVREVLDRFGVQYESKLAGTYPPRDYCVQYDETAFDFVTRLMADAGIAYHFAFGESGHTMVLTDENAQFADVPGGANVRFWPDTGLTRPQDAITRFTYRHQLAVQGTTVDDYDFRTPATALQGTHNADGGKGTDYEYASGHASADAAAALARLRIEATRAETRMLHGDSRCAAFAAGTRFTLANHFVSALNGAFVLRRVHHTADRDSYANTFEALPSAVPFRPEPLARPRVAGCETAVVVGPDGEEIWTDRHGRVKVRFHWDRGERDHERAPWVRVAQPAAGNGFGALFLPRIGHEVVIAYVDGDPDRPLVSGCVYNGVNVPPAGLPGDGTQTILRSRTSKDGEAGNELRFEDRKDAEQFYLHAQKDMLAEIENALTTTVRKGAETHTVEEGDRTVAVKKGGETHTVAGTRGVTVTGDETHANDAGYTHTVKGDYALTVDGSLTITVTGALKLVTKDGLTLDAAQALAAKAGTALTCEAGTDLTTKAGKALLHKAGLKIESRATIIDSKADAMHTVEAGASLTLKGALAKVN